MLIHRPRYEWWECRIQVAKCFETQLLRGEDRVFRLGGEEFGIIFSSKTKENAIGFANKIKDAIANLKIPHEFSNVLPYVTISGGLVCQDAKEVTCSDQCFKKADDLLYISKREGKNRITSSC